MNEAMLNRILETLKEKTGKDFVFDETNDVFRTSVTGLNREMISKIESVFMAQTYGIYEWEVKSRQLLFPYFLCTCHGCSQRRREMLRNGTWIDDKPGNGNGT